MEQNKGCLVDILWVFGMALIAAGIITNNIPAAVGGAGIVISASRGAGG